MLTTMTNQEFLLERAFSNTHTKTCQSQSLKVTDCLCWQVPLKKQFENKNMSVAPGLNKFKLTTPITSSFYEEHKSRYFTCNCGKNDDCVKCKMYESSTNKNHSLAAEKTAESICEDKNKNYVSQNSYAAIESIEVSQDGLVTITPKNNKKSRVRPPHRLKTHILNLCSKKHLRKIVSSGESPTCFHCLARLNKQLTSTVSKTLVPPSNYDI